MKLIRLFLSTSWKSIALAVVTGFLSGASSAGLIALINTALRGTHLSHEILTLGFFGLCLLLLVSATISQMCISRLAAQIIFDLQLLLTRRILACPLRHLEEIGVSRLLAALTQDIEVIAAASIPISTLCLSSLTNWLLRLLMLVIATTVLPNTNSDAVGYLQQSIFNLQRKTFLKLAREQQDCLFRHFRTATEGIKELKLHQQRREAFLTEDLQTTAAKSQQYRMTATDQFAIGGSWGLVALFILTGLLIFVAPLLFTIPAPILAGYALTLIFMLTPIRNLLNILPELLRANIALEKINSLGLSLVAQKIEPELPALSTKLTSWRALQLIGVTHVYRGERDDSHFTLGPINLILHPGELVFVVGGNGSGKSTLVKLLTGLYVPEVGAIEFDSQPIVDANREWYRQQFSVVFSDFYLFDRLLGLNGFNRDRQTREYLEQLQLDGKVKVNNGTLSTTALSQGQRKRLALLTAYLEDRAIYVFDEWASDQDPTFKKIFYTQLLPELRQRGKAIVVVSHDDCYFDRADRIVKLDYGKVEYDKHLHVEEGDRF